MDFTAKRQALAADFEKREAEYEEHFIAEAKAGGKISARPVAFLDDEEVVALPADAARIVAGLKQFQALVATDQEAWDKRARAEPAVAYALAKAAAAIAAPPESELRVGARVWNALMFALGEVGVKVVLADGR